MVVSPPLQRWEMRSTPAPSPVGTVQNRRNQAPATSCDCPDLTHYPRPPPIAPVRKSKFAHAVQVPPARGPAGRHGRHSARAAGRDRAAPGASRLGHRLGRRAALAALLARRRATRSHQAAAPPSRSSTSSILRPPGLAKGSRSAARPSHEIRSLAPRASRPADYDAVLDLQGAIRSAVVAAWPAAGA